MLPAHPHIPFSRRAATLLACVCALIGPALLTAPGALGAEALIKSFKAGVLKDENTSNPTEADYATQAGSHPVLALTTFEMNTSLSAVDDVRVDLPPGLSVNPQATPRCEASGTTLERSCAKNTRVGKAKVKVSTLLGTLGAEGYVYNMVPPSGAPADFAFEVTINAVLVVITARTDLVAGMRWYPSGGQPGDYGEYFTISGISNELGSKLAISELLFWGAPAEHNEGGAKNEAFLTNPTVCAGPQTTYMSAQTYEPISTGSTSFTTPVGASGCSSVPFAPSLALSQSTTKRDAPDAPQITLSVPQNEEPSKLASSQLKEALITLPEGLSLNPAAAVGLQACSEAQFGAGTNNAISCPAASEVGTAEVETPVLGEALKGKLYIGEPKSQSPESGQEYRLFLAAESSRYGVALRQIGEVKANAASGRLSARFAALPQLPFAHLKLSFKSGEHALFANPLGCGSASVTSSLSPYSGNPPATPSASFSVDNNGAGEACPATLPFAPKSSAQLSSKQAGAPTSLALTISREAGEEELSGITLKLPEGLLANLNGVKLCEEAQAAEGSCPAESKVGSASVSAGAGSEPLSLAGSVYLTGPYKGAPFGLAIVVPAIAGPYNLGTVVVRAAVGLNMTNGQLSITTDALPQIVGGVPLRIRSVKIEINRTGFLVNPTSCGAASVSGQTTSSGGQGAAIADALTVEGCSGLAFAASLVPGPLTLALDSPFALTLGVDLAEGDAAARSATVTLPAGVSLNPAVARGLEPCTEAELGVGTSNAISCPESSRVGSVTIKSPLLPNGLTGSLYIGAPLSANPESGEEYRLFLAASSSAYELSVRLIGELKASRESGRLTAIFTGLPPIPFTEMALAFSGGARAGLATPQSCGSASFSGSLEATNGASAAPSASVTVAEGASGGSCPQPAPFAPVAGAALGSTSAAAPTSLSFTLTRADGEQTLSSLSATLPAGMLGLIPKVALCAEAAAEAGSCEAGSQIGTATVTAGVGSEPLTLSGNVYLTGPYGGAPFGLSIVVPAKAGPYNLGTVVVRAAVAVSTQKGQLTVTTGALPTILGGIPLRLRSVSLSISRSGFLLNPSSCQATSLSGSATSTQPTTAPFSVPISISGCEGVPFAPSIEVTPATTQRDRPDGATLSVKLPEGSSQMSAATLTLPEGLTINPSAAVGLQACSEAQFEAGTSTPPGCPSASVVGSVEVLTPALAHPLTGSLYVGEAKSQSPESGQEYRLLLFAQDSADALAIKLAGSVRANAATGRLSASFSGLPPVPVSALKLSFKSGEHALFANPLGCGSASVTSSLSPYSGNPPATPSASFSVDNNGAGEACPATLPFAPKSSAQLSSKQAGAPTSLALTISREAGEEDLSGITLKLPEGLLANLNGVKLCEEAQAAEGSCPAESKVGSASVSAGAGSEPLSLAGSVYLTGPYKGAPFGLAIVVPAIAGPYNLGTVVVRAAVGLNMTNGQLSITTDALPQIVGGVPLRIRSVKIEINRSGFLVNPTSCGAASVSGQTTSSGGQGAAIADALTVEGCSGLAFAPTFALTSSTSRRDWPSTLGIALHLPAGNAALKQTVITLPPGLSLNPPAASGIEGCATEALGLGSESPITCPAASEIGTVAITSPLLPGALSGKLYVGAPLNADPESGEEYRLFLAAKSATYNISLRLIGKLIANRETGQLRAVFEGLPPLPFSEMTLQVNGGKQPLFATPLACGTAVADATLTPASGGAAATPSASFSVDNNGAGEACPATLPFAPKSSAQLSSKQAGAPTSLALTISREAGEEDLSGITLKLPEGLLANLNGVKLCEEAQAAEGSCPAESKVGSASVSAGAGSEPLSLAGSVYLTKAYGGGPLGLAIAIPASVGPYNAGTVVVRAAVIVDTVDGQITIKTDPLPQVVDGLPLRLRNLKVEISRSGFMVNPSTCSAPLSLAGTLASSGGQGSSFTDALQLEGCKTLAFDPSFTVTPSQAAIESALPLEIALALPSGDSTLHQATVALPEGVSINPSVASGLEGCSDQQLHLGEDVPVACPPASQIGSVKITSPLLPEALTGAIYIGAPLSSSPESGEEYRLFVAAESPNYGIPLRLIGRLAANTSSGRLTATFAETPPIPFTEMRLSFNGGAHAPLASPSTCGSAQLASSLIATSGASAAPGAAIAISANGEGEGCPASLPFAPALSLTPSSAAAGAPDALALSVEGSDRQQKLGALETTLPPGLLGEIANVALCGEPEAGQGTCPGASEVGTASAIVGIGSEPLQLSGPVYLTGPYGGAPFGLSIAIPAAAGPYNLGTVVVRAAISVNPQSAQLTIKSSSFPTILGGIPLRLKGVRISLQRPSFIVNPTSCAALTLSALVTSAAGAQSAASSPFQASGCQSLAFAPTISASTQSPSSRTEGAGLETVITYPSEGEANLASVGVSLPAQLVARTSTLGDACPEATFEANPESCPAAARVGSASVLTPVLPGTLAGPAYLVSDGAAFPALDLVLSADGVRIILHGATAIHAGTTSASFSGLPDVPIKRFDLVLPAGPTSLLAANGSLCSGALQMPATLSAQSGAQLARQVAIAVAGCAPGSGTEGEGATASGRSPLAHLTITPTHFAAQTPAAERSAHRRALHVGARIAWSDAHAASTLFHIERLVAGVKHGRSCIAVKGTLRRPGARGGRRGRPCVVRVPVSVQQTVRGIRHGKRCVLARRGAQGARCILRRVVSSFVHRDRAGSNSMPFTGLLGGRPLAPGAYLLIAETSVPGSRRNARATAKFWIVRG